MKELLELKKTNGNGKSEKKNLFQDPKLLVKDAVFVRHEGSLVKVKFDGQKENRHDIAPVLAERTGSTLVQELGHVAVFFRPLPAGRGAGR